jgi:hypothetical protein
MSHLMDYGTGWPPRPPRRRSLLRWVADGRRRHRHGFDRWVAINAALIVLVGVIVALALKASDRPPALVFSTTSPTPTGGSR